MRIVLIGVSHWHVPFYLDPCLDLPGVAVVGVSDADPARWDSCPGRQNDSD